MGGGGSSPSCLGRGARTLTLQPLRRLERLREPQLMGNNTLL